MVSFQIISVISFILDKYLFIIGDELCLPIYCRNSNKLLLFSMAIISDIGLILGWNEGCSIIYICSIFLYLSSYSFCTRFSILSISFASYFDFGLIYGWNVVPFSSFLVWEFDFDGLLEPDRTRFSHSITWLLYFLKKSIGLSFAEDEDLFINYSS